MKVKIKSFDVSMEIKNNGVELEVREPDDGKTGKQGDRLGDCFVTKTGLVWCKGKTKRENGVQVSWKDFISWMES